MLHSIGCPEKMNDKCNIENKSADEVVSKFFYDTFGIPTPFENTCWFHATRLTDKYTFFEEGLLTLSQMKPRIWRYLRSLCKDMVNDDTWSKLKHKAESFLPIRGKTYDVAEGPFAFLVREPLFIYPFIDSGNRDYFQGSELVEDLCEGMGGKVNDIVWKGFLESTTPAVIKFVAPSGDDEIQTALCYLWARHWSMTEAFNCFYNICFDGEGVSIPSSRILGVDFFPECSTVPIESLLAPNVTINISTAGQANRDFLAD